jgi:hypothetical protein
MRKLFIDAVQGGEEGFQSMGKFYSLSTALLLLLLVILDTHILCLSLSLSLGFQRWARYKDVWRNV